ncbi:hypothetical protein OROGR_026823 [Orobanche gracilis]
MFGSARMVADIALRLRQNLSLGGVCVRNIHIGGGVGGEIPDNKRLEYALQHIHGIGRSKAHHIVCELGIENKYVKDLSKRELYSIRDLLSKYLIGNDLEAVDSPFHEDDIETYIEEFEAHSALIPDQWEEQAIGMFLRGLHENVRNWVCTLSPDTCDTARDFAHHMCLDTTSQSDSAKNSPERRGKIDEHSVLQRDEAYRWVTLSGTANSYERPHQEGYAYFWWLKIMLAAQVTDEFVLRMLCLELIK